MCRPPHDLEQELADSIKTVSVFFFFSNLKHLGKVYLLSSALLNRTAITLTFLTAYAYLISALKK